MADLLSKDMIADLILNIINILVLFFVTRALLYKPVKKFLNARAEKLEAAQKEAADAKAQAQMSKAKYDAVLSDAEKVRTEAVEKAEAEAKAAAERILAEAKAQAAEAVETGRKKAESERKKILDGAKEDIVDATLDATEKLLGRVVADEDNRRIIDGFFG